MDHLKEHRVRQRNMQHTGRRAYVRSALAIARQAACTLSPKREIEKDDADDRNRLLL
jgi:hypothetical protein